MEGISCLEIACTAKHWELITLLLEHGAKMVVPQSLLADIFTRHEQEKLFALVKMKSNLERPPQVCPCWSGKLLKDCHAEEQPYPARFICVCGSEKIYERCCLHKHSVIEKWDPAQRRILHYFDDGLPIDNELRSNINSLVAALIGPSIDPAFTYALGRSAYHPAPLGSNFSRKIQEGCQQQWNALVDEYISKGTDKRSRFDIERAAKIGIRAGALIGTCEGKGCSKVEKRDVDTLKICARCRIAVYCTPSCQKSSWSSHKLVCCTEHQVAQPLPSQITLAEFGNMYKP